MHIILLKRIHVADIPLVLRMHFWESGAAAERPGSADSAVGAEGRGSVNEVDQGPHSSP